MRIPVSGHIREPDAPHAIAAMVKGDQLPNLIVFVACLALLVGVLILNPPDPVTHNVTLGHQHLPSVCTLKNLTGLPCPGCGLVRSTAAMVHGDIAGSIAYHRLGWLILIYIFAQLVYRSALLTIPMRRSQLERYGRYLARGLLILAVLFFLNWLLTLADKIGLMVPLL